MELQRERAVIEAILFLESEPIELERIAKISGLKPQIVETILSAIGKDFSEDDSRGIELIEQGGGYLFSIKREPLAYFKRALWKKSDEKMSKAALETLSIIAYSQPVTRAEIENIRGVSIDNLVRLLLRKGLVKEVGKKDIPGKPSQYGTTKEFLKIFRLKSIADLPKLTEIDQERFELNA